jgi:hypothetical protein
VRIAHHPGIVLEVLVADNDQDSSSATETLGYISNSVEFSADMGSMDRDMVSLRITEVGDDNQALVHPQSHPSERHMSHHASSPLHNTCSYQPVPLPQQVSNSHHQPPRLPLEMGSLMTEQDVLELEQLEQLSVKRYNNPRISSMKAEATSRRWIVKLAPSSFKDSQRSLKDRGRLSTQGGRYSLVSSSSRAASRHF